MVREWIYTKGFPVGGTKIEKNAFSEVLLPYGVNFYQMFIPDLMHESTVQALNCQYWSVPTFGHSTIHKFSNDVSGQKKLAARDYEDLLQLHHFVKTVCTQFKTKETPAEMAAWVWRYIGVARKTLGEQEHHWVKLFYIRTNKCNHVKQIAKLKHHQCEKEPLPPANPEDHYQMSMSWCYPLDLHSWLAENRDDLAIVDFIPKLKDHILQCLLSDEISPYDDPTPEQ
ncbi:hypothetical protein EV421DRAFT_1742616 [Armillaria borealis]|uniref:Uncharacterized protein n=1 Tax=Armillaria borealis TaxID=47425 RepID=A0AA39IWX5_9AGAR|nr:hypothetical protein EV421DRAFT_1742616 [Armillaria borealis]